MSDARQSLIFPQILRDAIDATHGGVKCSRQTNDSRLHASHLFALTIDCFFYSSRPAKSVKLS